MNYYKARMYSPTLGRFMQPDPIGYGDGMNLYAYVGGDPVNFVDPSGLRSQQPDGKGVSCVVQTGSRLCVPPGSGSPHRSDPLAVSGYAFRVVVTKKGA